MPACLDLRNVGRFCDPLSEGAAASAECRSFLAGFASPEKDEDSWENERSFTARIFRRVGCFSLRYWNQPGIQLELQSHHDNLSNPVPIYSAAGGAAEPFRDQ